MQKLMQSGLFRLLSETSQNENNISQLEESYDEFAMNILTRLQLETNHTELYYTFGFVHLKLAGTCERLSGGEGKKRPENSHQGYVSGWTGYAGTGMADYCSKQ